MMQTAYENGALFVAALGTVLVLLNLGQLWFGRRYVLALKEHDHELRQLRVSMQQLEGELTNSGTLLTKHVAEDSVRLQQLQIRVDETSSELKDWNTAADAVASELQALMKSDEVTELMALHPSD
jgi:hypothetical protein